MSLIDQESITNKLEKLTSAINVLNEIKPISREENVQLSCQRLEEVHQHLQKAPDVFRQFARHYYEYISQNK